MLAAAVNASSGWHTFVRVITEPRVFISAFTRIAGLERMLSG